MIIITNYITKQITKQNLVDSKKNIIGFFKFLVVPHYLPSFKKKFRISCHECEAEFVRINGFLVGETRENSQLQLVDHVASPAIALAVPMSTLLGKKTMIKSRKEMNQRISLTMLRISLIRFRPLYCLDGVLEL